LFLLLRTCLLACLLVYFGAALTPYDVGSEGLLVCPSRGPSWRPRPSRAQAKPEPLSVRSGPVPTRHRGLNRGPAVDRAGVRASRVSRKKRERAAAAAAAASTHLLCTPRHPHRAALPPPFSKSSPPRRRRSGASPRPDRHWPRRPGVVPSERRRRQTDTTTPRRGYVTRRHAAATCVQSLGQRVMRRRLRGLRAGCVREGACGGGGGGGGALLLPLSLAPASKRPRRRLHDGRCVSTMSQRAPQSHAHC
jgi:hypothetical protein